jgi:hypothetical protein
MEGVYRSQWRAVLTSVASRPDVGGLASFGDPRSMLGYLVSATSLNAATRGFSSFPRIPERMLYASARGIVGL